MANVGDTVQVLPRATWGNDSVPLHEGFIGVPLTVLDTSDSDPDGDYRLGNADGDYRYAHKRFVVPLSTIEEFGEGDVVKAVFEDSEGTVTTVEGKVATYTSEGTMGFSVGQQILRYSAGGTNPTLKSLKVIKSPLPTEVGAVIRVTRTKFGRTEPNTKAMLVDTTFWSLSNTVNGLRVVAPQEITEWEDI